MDQQNQLLGLLHGSYGLGATISPLIATTLVTRGGLGWWTFYYIMVGVVTFELIAGTAAFWRATGSEYRELNRTEGYDKGMTTLALKKKVTWICSVFFLAYVGTEGQPRASLHARYELPIADRHIYSVSWRLDRYVHDANSSRTAFCLRLDSHWLLAGLDRRTNVPRLFDRSYWGACGCLHIPSLCHGL